MNKTSKWYMGAVLIILPLLFYTGMANGDPIRYAKEWGLVFLCVPAYFYCLNRYFGVLIALLFSYCLLNAALSGWGTAQQITIVIMNFCLLATTPLLPSNDATIKFFLKCLAWGSIPICIEGILQALNIDPIFKLMPGIMAGHPMGFFGQETVFGPWAAMAGTAALWLGLWPIAIINFALALLTKSSFTYLCIGGGVWSYLYWIMNKKCFSLMTFAAFCIAIATLFHMRHSEWLDFNGRAEVWETTWNAIMRFKVQHKIFGSGIGTYKIYYPIQFEPKNIAIVHGAFIQAHNELLQSIFELGWLGFSIILVGLIKISSIALSNYRNKWRFAACSIFFVLFLDSLGSFPIHLMPHGLIVLMSFLLATRHKDRLNY